MDAVLALERVDSLAQDELIEPLSAYESNSVVNDSNPVWRAPDSVHGNINVRGNDNQIFFGTAANCAKTTVTITGSNNIVFFGAYCRLGQTKLLITGNNCIFFIGAFSTCEEMTVKLGENGGVVHIGSDCMLAARIVISNVDGHGIYDLATRKRLNEPADVFIGSHVWIGRSTTISKGATIGENCIVGQASLVTKGSKPSNSILAGVPAKVIRKDVAWSRWNLPDLDVVLNSKRHAEHLRIKNELSQQIRQQRDAGENK